MIPLLLTESSSEMFSVKVYLSGNLRKGNSDKMLRYEKLHRTGQKIRGNKSEGEINK